MSAVSAVSEACSLRHRSCMTTSIVFDAREPPRVLLHTHPEEFEIMASAGKGHQKDRQGTSGGKGAKGDQKATNPSTNDEGKKYGSTGSKSSGGTGSSQGSGVGHGGSHG